MLVSEADAPVPLAAASRPLESCSASMAVITASAADRRSRAARVAPSWVLAVGHCPPPTAIAERWVHKDAASAGSLRARVSSKLAKQALTPPHTPQSSSGASGGQQCPAADSTLQQVPVTASKMPASAVQPEAATDAGEANASANEETACWLCAATENARPVPAERQGPTLQGREVAGLAGSSGSAMHTVSLTGDDKPASQHTTMRVVVGVAALALAVQAAEQGPHSPTDHQRAGGEAREAGTPAQAGSTDAQVAGGSMTLVAVKADGASAANTALAAVLSANEAAAAHTVSGSTPPKPSLQLRVRVVTPLQAREQGAHGDSSGTGWRVRLLLLLLAGEAEAGPATTATVKGSTAVAPPLSVATTASK